MELNELFEKEIKTGYKNSSVFGGFAAFLSDAAEKQGLAEAADLAACYNVASLAERKKLLPLLRQACSSLQPEAQEEAKPETSAANEYRSNLSTPIQYMKSIGPKRAAMLKKLGINTVEDILYFFPRYFKDRSRLDEIGSLPIGDQVNIRGRILRTEKLRPRANMLILKAWITDGTGVVPAVWFNQKFLEAELYQGREIFVCGTTSKKYNQFQLAVTEYEFLSGPDEELRGMQPVYALTEGLSQKVLRNIIIDACEKYASLAEETLPEELRRKLFFPDIATALCNMHMPQSREEYEAARRRFAYEELLLLQLAINADGAEEQEEGICHKIASDTMQRFREALPYKLTGAQERVIAEIYADMESDKVMSRLCCGDVGSGKTVVAAAAMWLACRNGHQAVMMAPTEILAAQHYQSLQPLLQKLGITCCLITGSVNGKAYQSLVEALASGEMQVAIGTQALIQENIVFRDLSLAIADEQHRFGVRQRSVLQEKGKAADLLVMTATPIPRSLALAFYGDLQLSVIDELPPGRKEIKTYAVGYDYEQRIWAFLEKEMQKGRQCFIVCPLVEESEKLDLQSATALYEQLSEQVFPHRHIGLLHGKMKAAEKDSLMCDFAAGKIDMLVSTTVVEVGINVPNATVMLVRDAERFGLAQLHQLRGRIGRGGEQSYCVLMHNAVSSVSRERMKIMTETTDGFKIAEADLRLRGPGEFFGTRQHGLPELKVADLFNDAMLLEQARQDAMLLLKNADFRAGRQDYALLASRLREKRQALN